MLSRREALAVAAASIPLVGRAAEPELKLATFEVEVTPPIGHPCMGGGIAPVKEILDPLYAHGLIFLGSGQPLAIVCVDWCEIRNGAYDLWRESIAKAIGTKRERVLVNANHQHDAPIADLEAQKLLEEHKTGAAICDLAFLDKAVARVAKAAKDAIATAQPLTHVGIGQAKVEKVASNRRYMSDGKPFYNRMSATRDEKIRAAEEGTIDPNLKALSFWNGDKPLAVLHSYSTHPMSYYGRGGATADFVGLARRQRQAALPGTLMLYASGCSGNTTAGKYNDGATENRAVLAGRMHDGMKKAWQSTKKHPIQMSFRSTTMALEPRKSKGFSTDELMNRLKTGPRPFDKCLAALGLSWKRRCEAGQPVDVPLLDFGVAQYLLMPAEAYVEFQLAAQELRPDSFVMVAGYGECGPGYIPIERAWKENDANLGDWCWIADGSEAKMRSAMAKVLKK
jgi:hypothetical protein